METITTILAVSVMLALITIALAIPFWIIVGTGRALTRMNAKRNSK
jgi:outer membrane lipoprotein-sorting protein